MRLIYCYDAYCGWCYGFTEVMKQLQQSIPTSLPIEVVSGGMLVPNYPMPISIIAPTILENYKSIEEHSGIKFGSDFLWHVQNPQESDWFPNSLTPAIALSIIKKHSPELALNFALAIEYGLNFEGRDLTDLEAYRHLMPEYNMEFDDFATKMKEDEYKALALRDFETCQQLKVNSFPVLLLQANESKFFLIAKGYTPLETILDRIDNIMNQIKTQLN